MPPRDAWSLLHSPIRFCSGSDATTVQCMRQLKQLHMLRPPHIAIGQSIGHLHASRSPLCGPRHLAMGASPRYYVCLLYSCILDDQHINMACAFSSRERSIDVLLHGIPQPAKQSHPSQSPMTGGLAPRGQGNQKNDVLVCPQRVLVDGTVEATMRAVVPTQCPPLCLGDCRHIHDGHTAEKLLWLRFHQAWVSKSSRRSMSTAG